jgi:ribosomal protein L7/L12
MNKQKVFTALWDVYDEVDDSPIIRQEIASIIKRLADQYAEATKSSFTREERIEAETVGKIALIKMVRQRTGMSLKDAKDLVEREAPREGIVFYTPKY